MAAQRNYLALDLGAESGRGLLGTFDGGRLSLQEVHRWPESNVKLLNRRYWDLPCIFANLMEAVGRAAAERELRSIAVDTWGVDFGLLAGDCMLGNPVHYRDARTDGIMEKAFERVSKREIFEATGIQFMQINTIFQLYSMVLENSPLLAAADTLLMMPSLLNFFFTGRKVDERTAASTSQLLDPHTGRWAQPLFDRLAIPFAIAPDLIAPGEVIANIHPGVAEEIGAAPVPVVAVGSHDTASAVAAVPAETEKWCYISCGTWSLMGIEIPEPIVNDKALEYGFTNEGGVGGTIRFLKNIMGLWLVQECRRQWEKEGDALSYGQITAMAAEAEPMRCFVDCTSDAFLAPGGMPDRIVAFCRNTGQQPPQNKGQIARCALESLALTYRETLGMLEEITGGRIDVIHIVGGGTQNDLLCQFAADACNRPVVAGPIEATAIGNVLMQAVALGDLAPDDLREVVRNSFSPIHYEPKDTARWNDAWERFQKISRT